MIPVRQSTAFECSIGPVLDADGVAVTDCVVGDFKIKKTTGNFAALNASATLTHVSAGTYDLVLTTSDTDTVGLCSIAIDDTVNACAPVYLQVMEEAIYDALYAASANAWSGAAGSSIGTANLTQISGASVSTSTAQLGVNVVNFGGSAGTFSSGRPSVDVNSLAANSITAAAASSDFGAEIQALITGGAYALNTNASGYIRIVDGTGTGELDTASGLVRLSAAGVDDIWDEAFSGHQTAGTMGLVINEIDAIYQNAYDGITARMLANVTHANGTLYSTAVTTPLSNLITTVGVAGAGLTAADDAVIAAIAALNNLSAAQVWAAGTRTLTALGFTLAASDLAADIITAAKVAADVWTEGRTAINGGDYALSTDANGRMRIVDGTAAGELDTSSGKVLLAATQAFDNTGTWTGNLTGNVGGNLVGNVLGTIAELTTTTRALPGQVTPSATPTLAEAIMQMFQQHTNPTDQNSSIQRIYNRAGNVVHQKRTASDDNTTAALGALVAGP